MNALQHLSTDESALLPFGPANREIDYERSLFKAAPSKSQSPLLVTAVAKAINGVGEVWMVQHYEYGILLRCSVGSRQFRIVVPSPLPSEDTPTQESNSLMHVVSDMESFSAWLSKVSIPTE